MRSVLALIALLSSFVYGHATHIVGGELTYIPVGNNNYKITLKLYIDCFNGQAAAIAQDLFANIGVFSADSNQRLDDLCFAIKRDPPIRVSKTNYNCIKIAPNACVDAYFYDTVVSLPYRPGGYLLSFQRCCRNNTILNLVAPDATGENLWTHVVDTAGIGNNSSPVFKNLPPNFLCTNAPLIFDHSAVDTDGDSLVYEFFHPYTGGSQNDPRPVFGNFEDPPFSLVTFQSGYSAGMAINSSPNATIDRKTGILRLTPTVSGQFVVGIVVKEYRKGQLIGFTQRDYQFNVQQCVFETTSAFATPDVNCDREVFFTNNSSNASSYLWNFGDSTTLADTSNTPSGYYKYPKAGVYTVKLIARNGNCMDSIIKTVTILENIKFKLPADTLLCIPSNVILRPDVFFKPANYLWSTGATDSVISAGSEGQYWLRITYGKCVKYDTCQIFFDHQGVGLGSDSLKCNSLTKNLEAIMRAKGDFASIEWFTESGKKIQKINDSTIWVNEAGRYGIRGIKKNGCPYSDSISLDGKNKLNIFKFANVFTPNGDNINDFYPDFNPSYNYHLTIFDRWGIKIFDSQNIPWNAGQFPDGTYYYFIEADGCGEAVKSHGSVMIIR